MKIRKAKLIKTTADNDRIFIQQKIGFEVIVDVDSKKISILVCDKGCEHTLEVINLVNTDIWWPTEALEIEELNQ